MGPIHFIDNCILLWDLVGPNDILIPVLKVFTLSQLQSQLVVWAFYVAYFIGSIIFFVSLKVDILQKIWI
jgi:FHS family L-fucose permease-like MFS transporter